MKKILLAVAVLLSVNAFSQTFTKKIASSDKDIADPKKGENPKTWISRGQLFYEIAAEPTKGFWAGMNEAELKLMLTSSSQKLSEPAVETIGNKQYKVSTLNGTKIFFENDVIVCWDIPQYPDMVANPIETSYKAYLTAIEKDAAQKNSKKINEGLRALSVLARAQGSNDYQLGHRKESFNNFELSLNCSFNPLVGETDSMIIYYAGVIARELEDYPKAEKYLRKAIEINSTESGDAYGILSEVLSAQGRKAEAMDVLHKGMPLFPENQQIMVSIINLYISEGKDPKDIIPLLQEAQKAQPENASLFFVEGNLYEKLYEATSKENKDYFNSATESYKKSLSIDPNYFGGYYGLAALIFNEGVYYNEKANAVPASDEAEYQRLLGIANEHFKSALPYFQKAYELDPKEKAVIQALKDINFRFRTESEEFQKNADKFKELLDAM
jgi:tetratricopeptide (TPR) repeat protein